MQQQVKLEHLKSIIQGYQSVLVAFSGGVDSTLVLKVARGVLGRGSAKAVTAESESVQARELDVEHRVIETRELENPSYRQNPAARCYFCKTVTKGTGSK